MRISVCIIAQNEEKNIERCLKSLQPFDVEIIVVDTGSVDTTKEIAFRYTDFVYDFTWCDDFAAAKNFAISKASNQYVMILDSDEYIMKFDADGVKKLLYQHIGEVGRIKRHNFFSRKGIGQENIEWINRIFAKSEFHYEGRIHEQVAAKNGNAYKTYETPVQIGHTGYDLPEKERREKAKRNILLLELELKQKLIERGRISVEEDAQIQLTNQNKEEGPIPYLLYQLGKSYYMSEEYQISCEYFSKALCYDLNPRLEYVIDMVETYGYALVNSGRAAEALMFENIYDEFSENADFQFLMGIIYMNNERFMDAVCEFEKATQHKESRAKGVNSYMAFYNIGVIYECLGEVEQARIYYRKCDGYKPACYRLSVL